jgi:gliding motility-associated-like protein
VDTDIEYPIIEVEIPELLTCVKKEVKIDARASAKGSMFTYEWTSSSGSAIADANTLLAGVSEAGNYTLFVSNENNGCTNKQVIEIFEDIELPEVNISEPDEIICDRPVVEMDGSKSSSGPKFQFRWSTQEGNLMDSNNSATTSVDKGGTYFLEVTNTENGCQATNQVQVIENTNYPTAAEITPDPPRCYGENGAIQIGTITGGEGPYVYSFDGGANFSTQAVNPMLPADDYEIVILDMNGCSFSEVVTIPEAFQLLVELDPETTIQLGDEHLLDPFVNIPNADIGNIQWTSLDSLSCTDCLTPVVAPLENTAYSILVRDKNGCEASANTLLRIDRNPLVYIPNVFSPNNEDGVNDRFVIHAKASSVRQINTFQIFNRWGAKLFEANDFQPNDDVYGWDGRSRGELQNPAVFVYFVEIEFIDGRTEMFKGDVMLMR